MSKSFNTAPNWYYFLLKCFVNYELIEKLDFGNWLNNAVK